MKHLLLHILLLIFFSNCNRIHLKKVYLVSDCSSIKDFEMYNPKICKFKFNFKKLSKMSEDPDDSRGLNIIRINDSTINVKSYEIKNNKLIITGNMGNFNINLHLNNKNINEFVFLCYQKAFGVCN